MSLRPSLRSKLETSPLLYLSKIFIVSDKLKSGLYTSLIFADSSSLSRLSCSFNEKASSSSSSSLSGLPPLLKDVLISAAPP